MAADNRAGALCGNHITGAQTDARLSISATMHVLLRLFLAVVPLLLTVLFERLVMEGHLSFGSGEKDLFFAIPLAVWSLVYLCCYLALWWRRFAIARSVVISSALATGVVAVALLALFGILCFKSL